MDATVTIKLEKAITINGEKVDKLTMREPTVGDMFDTTKQNRTPAANEAHLMAQLCDISPEDIRQVSVKDYSRIVKKYVEMASSDED